MAIVENATEIRKLVGIFRGRLVEALGETISANIGHQSNSWSMDFHWSNSIGLWVAFGAGGDSKRYWTAFGLNQPYPTNSNSITTEMNFPLEGFDGRIAGVFYQDPNGSVQILHSGKIGGGKLGIGLGLFWDNYRGSSRQVRFRGKYKDFAVVGDLYANNLPYQVKDFVSEVGRIKSLGPDLYRSEA